MSTYYKLHVFAQVLLDYDSVYLLNEYLYYDNIRTVYIH